ncbi:MAG: GAP family protein [Halioglobus sp.]
MGDLLVAIAPLLLVDVLNPVLFAVLVYAAGSDRPIINSSALLLGHTIAYFSVGIAASYGMEVITDRLDNPKAIDFVIQTIIAVACLYGALASRGGGASEEKKPAGTLSPLTCLSYGVIINFIGAPFALPYLAMVDQILNADLSLAASVSVFTAYNIAYALPFALVPILSATMGDAARPLLDKINAVMEKGADLLMPWLMLAIGLWLLGDSIRYFLTPTT